MHRSIEQQIHFTYRSLRAAAAIIAFSFPLVLWLGGLRSDLHLRSAMSDYYWSTPLVPCPYLPHSAYDCEKPEPQQVAPPNTLDPNLTLPAGTMRTEFIGMLFAIGMALIANQGHGMWENIFLTMAGFLAWGIAIFPEQWNRYRDVHTKHGCCAIAFFLCIAVISGVFSRNTLRFVEDQRRRRHYQWAYNSFAALMVLSPGVALIFNSFDKYDHYVFIVEWIGIYAFALYWAVKTREMSGPDAEKRVIEKLPHSPPPLIPGT